MVSGNNDFLALVFVLRIGLGTTWQQSGVTWHNNGTSRVPCTGARNLHRERNKEMETF